MFILDPDLDFYPSRIQGSKMHWIADPDPQHWLLPSARGDKAETLGLYGDTGALDVLLHVPVDKGRFPRRMVPWRGENYITLGSRSPPSRFPSLLHGVPPPPYINSFVFYLVNRCCWDQCVRIQIRIHMFSGLPDPDPDPLVRGMDPDPSIIMKKL